MRIKYIFFLFLCNAIVVSSFAQHIEAAGGYMAGGLFDKTRLSYYGAFYADISFQYLLFNRINGGLHAGYESYDDFHLFPVTVSTTYATGEKKSFSLRPHIGYSFIILKTDLWENSYEEEGGIAYGLDLKLDIYKIQNDNLILYAILGFHGRNYTLEFQEVYEDKYSLFLFKAGLGIALL